MSLSSFLILEPSENRHALKDFTGGQHIVEEAHELDRMTGPRGVMQCLCNDKTIARTSEHHEAFLEHSTHHIFSVPRPMISTCALLLLLL